jgi:diketogulonate reductase-like aldo/keto reductase
MEAICNSGRARLLGVSNVTLEQLQSLHREARIPPRFVQNRCYAVQRWDKRVREFCAAHNIIYQGFSLLTANHAVLAHPAVVHIARRHGRAVAQIIFRFAFDAGMVALTGTTNPEHMRADLEIDDFRLEPEEVALIEGLAEAH